MAIDARANPIDPPIASFAQTKSSFDGQSSGEQIRANPPRRRFYSDRERADALSALQARGGNVWGTAKELGIPPATLNVWAGGKSAHPQMPVERVAPLQVQSESKRDLLGTLERARWLYLDRLTDPEAVQTTSGYYAAMTTKILTDQHQLLSGGATSRTELSLASFLGTLTESSQQAIDVVPSATALPAGGGVETNAVVGGGEGTQVLVTSPADVIFQKPVKRTRGKGKKTLEREARGQS